MENSDSLISALWGKKEERDGRLLWLPLVTHLMDTGNVIRWLWLNWLSDSQRDFCIRSLNPSDEDTALNLAVFLGNVHDIGKATPAFQIQRGFNCSPDLDHKLLEKLERAGFSGISDLELTEPRKTHHSIAGEYLLKEEFHVRDDIGSIIGGHHGRPIDSLLTLENQSAYPMNYFQSEESGSAIYLKWKKVQQAIFQQALSYSGFDSVKDLPELSQPAQVVYSGLLIMADWISSNSEYFPLVDIDEESLPRMENRYINGIKAWNPSLPLRLTDFPSADELFTERFGFMPREFQRSVCETVGRIGKPGLVILEEPMGLGKTEAALASAEVVAAKTGSSGLFFGLPSQATSNGMFGRVHQWLQNLTEDYGIRQSLRLCHGKAALNEEMNNIRNASSSQNINIDEEDNGSVFVNEWFTGSKKSSLDDFVVGTVDNFLLTALKQKHLALRHLGFSKKVLIIDEVHAYDTYMQQYLEEAIRWMGAYGTPVILASATLPEDRRKNLVTAYLKGMGVKGREISFPSEMSENKYPLISYTDGTEIKTKSDFVPMKDKVVHVNRLDEAQLYDRLTELLDGGGVVGIIVNTVRKAQKLGQECMDRFGEDTVLVLHSAFIATDRVQKENNLLKMIGSNAERPERKIIIGTQVIEQSLDIDFDVMITDLCPVDLLFQRIGRLHRHDIHRPAAHREPCVYLMGTSDQLEFDKGSERIYGSYFLIRTQYFLPDSLRIPSDIPILIGQVYGEDKLDLSKDLMEVYQTSREQMQTLKENKSDKARTWRLDHPRSGIRPEKYNLIKWLNNPDYSECEETAAAQVRDIMETIEVIAVKKNDTGYGLFEEETDISGSIDRAEIAKKLARQTIRLPNFVVLKKGVADTIKFLEDYNRKHLADWQKQPWLKGSLGIIFDENGCFELNRILLKYDRKLGLREEKDYGKI